MIIVLKTLHYAGASKKGLYWLHRAGNRQKDYLVVFKINLPEEGEDSHWQE
jgi:hypothetical protein